MPSNEDQPSRDRVIDKDLEGRSSRSSPLPEGRTTATATLVSSQLAGLRWYAYQDGSEHRWQAQTVVTSDEIAEGTPFLINLMTADRQQVIDKIPGYKAQNLTLKMIVGYLVASSNDPGRLLLHPHPAEAASVRCAEGDWHADAHRTIQISQLTIISRSLACDRPRPRQRRSCQHRPFIMTLAKTTSPSRSSFVVTSITNKRTVAAEDQKVDPIESHRRKRRIKWPSSNWIRSEGILRRRRPDALHVLSGLSLSDRPRRVRRNPGSLGFRKVDAPVISWPTPVGHEESASPSPAGPHAAEPEAVDAQHLELLGFIFQDHSCSLHAHRRSARARREAQGAEG